MAARSRPSGGPVTPLVLALAPALAADLTVRADGTGDFGRIQDCADVAGPGDRCLVGAGSWDERVVVRAVGTADAPVVFEAVASAVVRGFSLYDAAFVEIRGFEITTSGLGADGAAGVYLVGSADILVEGNSLHDGEADCVELEAAAESTRVVIRDNEITRCGFAARAEATGVTLNGDDNRVEDNDISHVADFVRLFGDRVVMRRNHLHDATWDDYAGEPHIDGMQTWCSTAWRPNALRQALVEDNLMEGCTETDCHFVITQDEGDFCGHRDLLVRHNVVRELGSYLVISNQGSDATRYVHNTATRTGIAFDPQDWVAVGFYGSATESKVVNNIFVDTVRDGGLVYEYDGSSLPGSDHSHNLAWNSACGAGCLWGAPLATDPGCILDQDPLHDPVTGALDPSSPAVDAGRALAVVVDGDAGSGTTLHVDDAGFFQDGWAGVAPDWIAVGDPDLRVQIRSIDLDADRIELDGSVDRAVGDPVWLARNSSRTVLAGAAPDLGAAEYGVPPEDTGDGGSGDGGATDGGTGDGGSGDGGSGDGGAADGGSGDGGSADGGVPDGGTTDGGATDGGSGDGGSGDGGSGDGGSGDGGAGAGDAGCGCGGGGGGALLLGGALPLLVRRRRAR